MSGFVRIYRRLFDNPVFRNETEALVFARLVVQAAWRDTEVRYRGRRYALKESQLLITYREMAERFGESEAKWRRWVDRLVADAMIVAETVAGVTRISICNYSKYQASKKDADAPDDAPDDADVTLQPTQDRRSADALNNEGNEVKGSPPLSPPAGGKRRRGSRLSDDWKPSQANRDYATARGMDPDRLAEDFRAYWLAKPGSGAAKLDWDLTWETWVRKDADKRPTQFGGQQKPAPTGPAGPTGGVADSARIAAMVAETVKWVDTPGGKMKVRVA